MSATDSMFGQLASWGSSMVTYATQQISSMWQDMEVVDPDADAGAKGEAAKQGGLFADERKAAWSSADYTQYIGLDVTTLLSVPIWIHEPASTLTKMAEVMEYGALLDAADAADDANERLALVAAFLVSPYGCAERAWKPFNPVLGETFELEGDLVASGGRYLAEQVSAEPPVAAAHAENGHWTYDLVSAPKTRFLGNALEVFPHGRTRIRLKRSGELFTHVPPHAKVHNLVIGRTWIDAFGAFTVASASGGGRVALEFTPCGWFSAGRYSFSGHVYDAAGVKKLLLSGLWNSHCDVVACTPDGAAVAGAAPRRLWTCAAKPGGDNYYGFTAYTHRLVRGDGLLSHPAPSDTRRRPDIAALYAGDSGAASAAMARVLAAEKADRRAAKDAGAAAPPAPLPRWFERAPDMEVLPGEESAEAVPLWRWTGGAYFETKAAAAAGGGAAVDAAEARGKGFQPWQCESVGAVE